MKNKGLNEAINIIKWEVIILVIVLVIVLLVGGIIGWNLGQHGVPFLKKQQEWSIGIYSGNTPFDMKSIKENPIITKESITDIDALFVADPFMIKENETWYLFYEIKDSYDLKTYIGLSESKDLINWDYKGVVLKENFAISYPYLFKWKETYYMIPETYLTNSIRLYKAIDFPEHWVFVETLIEGKDFVDPSIIRYDDKWWIFVSTTQNKDLYLYYADDLSGTWAEHLLSPIIKDNKNIARPGGRIIEYDGNLYRFTQDDEPYYGNQVWAFKITKLTETEYEEELVGNIIGKGNLGWNSKGMHNFDAHELDGGWIAVVDGYKEGIVWEN